MAASRVASEALADAADARVTADAWSSRIPDGPSSAAGRPQKGDDEAQDGESADCSGNSMLGEPIVANAFHFSVDIST
jgi:hypothetical protein